MMSSRMQRLQDLAQSVVDKAQSAGADVAESVARDGFHLSTKVRMGETELLEEAGSRSLAVRVMLGKQVAVTYTSDLSENGVTRLVEDAIELAHLAQPDDCAGPPDPSLLSSPEEHADLDVYDASVSGIDAAHAYTEALTGEEAAFAYDERITNSEGASFSRVEGASVLVTSGGFVGQSKGTYASLVVRPIAEDEDGKKHTGSYWTARRHQAELRDAKAIGDEAARRTLRKLGARKIKTQEAPVIFDQEVARSIIGLVAGCVMGSGIWRKSSYLVDRLGTQIASDLVTLVDDPLIPARPAPAPMMGKGSFPARTWWSPRGSSRPTSSTAIAAESSICRARGARVAGRAVG